MKLIVMSDLGAKPTRVGTLLNNNRPAGVHHIVNIANNHGVDAEAIDYWKDWPEELLIESIVSFFGDDPTCWISLSGSIDGSSTEAFKELVVKIKKHCSVKVMLGGYRVTVGDSSWVDLAFMGRCTNIFTDWLEGKDLDQYVHSTNPLTYKNPDKIIRETAVSVVPKENDFWSPRETMSLEMALGCKFNCSFCGYDYRGNKNSVFVDRELLTETMQTAYDKFGIKHFYLADDTMNEIDDKLELLGDVCEDLTFEPDLMGFIRLDVLGAQPHQIELIKRANIKSMFFGIESFSTNVTKLIRKGGKPEKNMDTLAKIRDEYPDLFTYGNFIIGLTGDSEKDIRYYAEKVVNEQLLTSAGSNTLRLYQGLDNTEIMSDIDLNPKKFGYEVIGTDRAWPELGYSSQSWANDWTSSTEAGRITSWLEDYYDTNLQSRYTAHEFQSIKSCLPGLSHAEYNMALPAHNTRRTKLVQKYIKQKSAYLIG